MTEQVFIPYGKQVGFLCPHCKDEVVWLPLSDHSEQEFKCSKPQKEGWSYYFTCVVQIVDGKIDMKVKNIDKCISLFGW